MNANRLQYKQACASARDFMISLIYLKHTQQKINLNTKTAPKRNG